MSQFGFGSYNVCNFAGNVGKDPVIKSGGEGDNAYRTAKFSVAVRKYNKKDPKKPLTLWINVHTFNEFLIKKIESFVHQGDLVAVNGEMDVRQWENEKSGKTEVSVELNLESFFVLVSKKKDETADAPAEAPDSAEPASEPAPVPAGVGGSGIPF